MQQLLRACNPKIRARIIALVGGPYTEGPNSVGVAEIKVVVEKTGGLVVLSEIFGHSVFKDSFKHVFDDEEQSLGMWTSTSGNTGRGRSVTLLPDVTSRHVAEERIHVDIDSRSDDVPEVDKNRLWQDIHGKRLAAQERQRLNDAPYVLSRGGYALLEKKMRKSRAEALGLESPDLALAPARDDILTTTIGKLEHLGRVRGIGGAIGLRDYFGPTQKSTQSMSQEAMRKMDL
ncbi:uncharacterized protein HKW66_Vig0228900 [Vigna angularis]|uniref:Uncharacterized protein n=1 Tax=Phaseolus angularis TaxID=3914 RepID=A0A8T0KES1_PHAAN|nr:uncharacterized protein HKW66_Vig0228900 [Vigna angularis]